MSVIRVAHFWDIGVRLWRVWIESPHTRFGGIPSALALAKHTDAFAPVPFSAEMVFNNNELAAPLAPS